MWLLQNKALFCEVHGWTGAGGDDLKLEVTTWGLFLEGELHVASLVHSALRTRGKL